MAVSDILRTFATVYKMIVIYPAGRPFRLWLLCGRGQPSHTLAAMGRSPLAIDTAIRVSFCADNTPEDVDAFLNRFEDGMKHLQRIRR